MRRQLRNGLLVGALACAHAAAAQAIFGNTEKAAPGDTIAVRGDGLDATSRYAIYPYSASGARGAAVKGELVSANGKLAMVRLPSNLANGVYEIVGQTATGNTNSAFVNAPRLAWSDTTELQSSGVVRLVGRNFKPFSTSTPTVKLTSLTTGAVLTATIVKALDNQIAFRVPVSALRGQYTVSVNNGLAGAASESADPILMTSKIVAADPFGLGVSWGGDFLPISAKVYNFKTDVRLPYRGKGDGVTDETQALAKDLIWVQQSGGGVLYVPAGTYLVDNNTARNEIRPNVVLRGEGKGKTIFKTGYTYTPTNAPREDAYPFVLWGEGQGLCGMCDFTIQNMNANAKSNGILRGGPLAQTSNKVFIKNVDFQMGNGGGVWITMPRKAVISDCNFTSTSLTMGPIGIGDAQEMQFVRNTLDWRASRCVFAFGKRNVFEGNTFRVDNAFHTPTSNETGGVELSYSQQVLFSDNDVVGYGPAITKGPLDGEMLMTQLSCLPEFSCVGMVRAAAGRLLTPTANFPSTVWQSAGYPTLPRMVVSIISGKGTGQWRMATTWTPSSVMVDRPWQVNPDATSRFSVSPLTNFQQTWIGNRISGGTAGMQIYQGAIDSVMDGNTLTNTGTIQVRADSSPRPAFVGGDCFIPAWDVSVTNNSVSETNRVMPAGISVAAIAATGKSVGNLVMSVDVRNNAINGTFLPTRSYQNAKNEGIEVMAIAVDSGLNTDSVLNVGTILQNNAITGALFPIQLERVQFGIFDNLMTVISSDARKR